MKNLKKTGLMLFFAILISGSAMAKGVVKVEVVPGENDKTLVDVLDVPNSKFEVELKDSNGKIVYTNLNRSPSFDYKKMYDFSELKNGEYTFEVKLNGEETEFDKLIVKDGKVQIVGQEEQIDPYFKLSGKFLEFSFPNSEHKDVRLLLYSNDTNDLVFQETINPEFDIKQALNLSRLDPGSYKATLINDNNAYDYNFYLN